MQSIKTFVLLVLVSVLSPFDQEAFAYEHPGLGKFIARDPIEYEGNDVNLYRYVGNSPVKNTDPDGTIFDSPSVAVRTCLQQPTYAQKLTCLESLLAAQEGGAASCSANIEKITAAINKLKNMPCGNLIRGTFKKSKSYASEFAGKTMAELRDLAAKKGPLQEKAKDMLKLVKDSERLLEKTGGKPKR